MINDTPFTRARLFGKLFPLGYKDDFRIIFLSALPIILSNFSQTFLPIVSLLFCGHIGSNELAAATMAGTFVNIIAYAALLGLASACDTLFPQLASGEDKTKLGIVLQKGLAISLISVLPSISLLLNIRYLMVDFIEEKGIVYLADIYILYMLPSVFFYSINCVLHRYVLAQDIFYPILAINVSSNILNAILHYILIFVLNMGLSGAAVSVSITNCFITVITVSFIYFKKVYLTTWSGWSLKSLEDWSLYLKLAIPGMLMIFLEWSGFEIGIITSGTLSKRELSTMAICVQTIYIAFMVPLGISVATNIRVGHFLGKNEPEQAKNCSKVAFTINFSLILILSTIIFLSSNFIPMAFTNDEEIIRLASRTLKFVSIIHFMDGAQGFFSSIIKSVGGQFYGSIIVFVSFYINGLPLGIYLMKKTDLRILGFWMGFLTAGIVLVILQIIFISRIDWIKSAKQAHDRTLKERLPPPVLEMDLPADLSEIERVKQLKRSRSIEFKIMLIFLLLVIFFGILVTRFSIEPEICVGSCMKNVTSTYLSHGLIRNFQKGV